MPEKRKTRATANVQRTTLKDLFQRTNSDTRPHEKPRDVKETPLPLLHTPDLHTLARPSKPSNPSQLYPIFTRAYSAREQPREDNEVMGIADVDISTDIESSTMSTRHATPRSEFSQATSCSIPSSPIPPSVQCDEGDTSLPRSSTREGTLPHKENKTKKRALGFGNMVPFPSSCSQHVRGLQHSYTAGKRPPRRSVFPGSRQPDQGTLDFLATWRWLDDTPSTPMGHVCWSLTPQQCKEYLQSISSEYIESYPAFAQISADQEEVSSLCHSETWTRRFRPRCANEVLGNERHALYLRDWLKALELRLQQPAEPDTAKEHDEKKTSKRAPRGMKRPRVIRTVCRKRGNKKRRVDSDDDLDDFVVFSDDDDDDEVDEPPADSEDEFAICRRGTTDADDPIVPGIGTNRATSETAENRFGENLTNTLLITGPPGCGKTAAVYACAEELGWDVFEVYPGIGKRNGASLDHLVGDVGRNHMVRTVHRRQAANVEGRRRMGLDGYLAKGKVRPFSKLHEAGTEERPINVEDGSPMHEAKSLPLEEMTATDMAISEESHVGSRPIVRQSVVLLEEVDILFKEDVGFWAAVVEFIGGCQRPVVMTCNDEGLVPVIDLPVQTVLVFEPCPSRVAASFLQCLALREGCLVPHEDLVVLYESTQKMDGIDMPDAPMYPRTEPVPLPDLRRSIAQLQIECAGRQGSTGEMQQGDEVRRSDGTISADGGPFGSEWWRKMRGESELMSHVDAELRRRGGRRGSMEDERDEEVGYVVLAEAEREERDELIAEEAIRQSRGGHEDGVTGPSEASIKTTREGFRARVAYQTRMVCALQTMVVPPAPVVPQMSVFVDYIPWVRNMVLVDDEQEREMGRMRGRRTRNSKCYVRCVELDEEELDMLRRSRLI